MSKCFCLTRTAPFFFNRSSPLPNPSKSFGHKIAWWLQGAPEFRPQWWHSSLAELGSSSQDGFRFHEFTWMCMCMWWIETPGCCWMSLLKSAFRILSLLESWTVASDSLDDIFPRRNTLLLALANGAEWPRALHVASEMVKDETSYNTLNFGCDSVAKNSVGTNWRQIRGMPPRIDALARGGQWEASLCILQVMFEETFIKANLSPQNWPINAGWWTLISEGYQFWNIPNLSQSDTEIWFQRYVFRVCQWPVTSIDYVNPYCNAGEHQAQSHFLQFCDKCLCQRRSLVGGTGASGENEEGQVPQSEPRTKRPDANDIKDHKLSSGATCILSATTRRIGLILLR